MEYEAFNNQKDKSNSDVFLNMFIKAHSNP